MSYEAKTQNLNLPQWVSGDKPEMLDFNKAFQAIDSGVGAKQNKIAASGILKGDGDGGVAAAVAGTDYATADMAIQTLTGTINFNTVTDTGLYRIKDATSFVNGPPVSSFPFDGVSYVDTLLQVDNFRSSVIMQTIRYGTTCMSRSTQMYGDGKTWGAWTASEWADKLDKAEGAVSGSNSNGRWVKFYDGTLICTNRFTWSFNMSTAWGSLYYGVYTADFTFPSPFSVLDHFGLNYQNGDIIGMSMMDKLPDLNGFNGRVMATTATPQTQNANVSYIAIGRWK